MELGARASRPGTRVGGLAFSPEVSESRGGRVQVRDRGCGAVSASWIESWAERLARDAHARARLFRLLWVVSTLFTLFGFVVMFLVLRRQGVL